MRLLSSVFGVVVNCGAHLVLLCLFYTVCSVERSLTCCKIHVTHSAKRFGIRPQSLLADFDANL